MSGHQTFAGALQCHVPHLGPLAADLAAPLRVGVLGRRGVGRDTVGSALTAAGFPIVDRGQDVDVLVIAEVFKPEDSALLQAAERPTLVVLNKADLTGFGPGGPMAAAHRQARLIAEHTGIATRPLVGLLAVAGLNPSTLDGPMFAALRELIDNPADLRSPDAFLAASHGVPTVLRERLAEALDMFGIAHAVVALRQDPDAGVEGVRAVLRKASGIDQLADAIEVIGREARYRRLCAVCDELEVLAVSDAAIAEFLAHDDAVLGRMDAAVAVVEAFGLCVDPTDDAGAHVNRALHWQHYASGPVSELHARCGTDIVRGSLRLLEPRFAGATP